MLGKAAAELTAKLRAEHSAGKWLHAAALAVRVGAEDPRYPNANPGVIDLQPAEGELKRWVRTIDAAWWPLMESLRARRAILRLNLPAGGSATPGVRHLAQRFSHVRLLIDAFRHGAVDGWQAQVRLAECSNVWLTTLGLCPGPGRAWENETEISDALHFALGEVGAGKILFASGRDWNAPPDPSPGEFLQSVPSLDDAARELILSGNAAGI